MTDIAAATTITPDDADGFVVTVDPAAMLKPVTPAIDAMQGGPLDAKIVIRNGAPVVEPSAPGRAVDWPATEAAVAAAVTTPNRAVELPYRLSEPSFTTEQATRWASRRSSASSPPAASRAPPARTSGWSRRR